MSSLPSTLFTWTETSGPTSLLFPTLPYHISLLPSLFRFLAVLVLLPVAILALIDVLGWGYHMFLLRPLGYASTIRFKDPEPTTLVANPLREAVVKNKIVRGATATVSAAPSSIGLQLSTAAVDGTAGAAVVLPAASTISRSSSASSSTRSSSSSSIRSPSNSPPTPPMTCLPTLKESDHLPRTSSESSISSMQSIRRARAASVGVEGPFIADEDLIHSPRSEDEDEQEILFGPDDTSGSESDGSIGGGARKGRLSHKGMPRGGPAFGFTGLSTQD